MLKNKSGIYTITNLVNGKFYVGSTSRTFRRRKIEHFSDLKGNRHPNHHLQNAYNKYGKGNFVFQIEEEIKDYKKALKREQDWLNFYWNSRALYNINRYVEGSPMLGRKQTKEARQKISEKV